MPGALRTAERSLAALETERPELVILDVRMLPGMDGVELLRRMKATVHLADIPRHHGHRQGRGIRQKSKPGSGRGRLPGENPSV